ncbi:MAG TPA: alpha/beta hydrolase [Spirochaetota bacterium]|nr:alpha/beta hydrolase [Spirochaetota bacterium]
MFTASDGVKIDIRESLVHGSRSILILWPCMTGNTGMYRLPAAEFNNAGISVIQFNPRGHADSGGQFDLGTCINDLYEYLRSLDIGDVPLWLIGHSAGASAVLKFGTIHKPARKYILVSPVLDSIASYRYLYENENQSEANILISSNTSNKEFMLSLLKDSRWMNREVWEKNLYREKIDAISGEVLIGTLMEKLFIEGYNAFHDLKVHSADTSILFPLSDNWFPKTLTLNLAAQYGIKTETINESRDHYFTGAWKFVWRRVLEEMSREKTEPTRR